MKIWVLLHGHRFDGLLQNTISSIQRFWGVQPILLMDGVSKRSSNPTSCKILYGVPHGRSAAPVANVALGWAHMSRIVDQTDWVVYLEYDCLVRSSRFLSNLHAAHSEKISMLGTNGRAMMCNVPSLTNDQRSFSYYFLGCFSAIRGEMLKKMQDQDYFAKIYNLLDHTGRVREYDGYDFSEVAYPSFVRSHGGRVGVLSSYDEIQDRWHGSYQNFPVRWKPEIPSSRVFQNASVLHPIKSIDHPLRKGIETDL